MKTKNQQQLVAAFLDTLDAEAAPLYGELILCLSELGYSPIRQQSSISFKHSLHNKQLAKVSAAGPRFMLRFSACRGYSQRFADAVGAAMARYPKRLARCTTGDCTYCKGAPDSHVYAYTHPDGTIQTSCGAYALEIPDLTAADLPALKALIREEHAYLMAHEAGSPIQIETEV